MVPNQVGGAVQSTVGAGVRADTGSLVAHYIFLNWTCLGRRGGFFFVGGEEILFHLILPGENSPSLGKSGQGVKAGTKAEATEKSC